MSEKSAVLKKDKRPVRNCRKHSFAAQLCRSKAKKDKEKERESQVRAILKKDPADRTSEEKNVITRNRKVVKILEKRAQSRELLRQKSQEVEDSTGDLERKVAELARVINGAGHVVVYTGAGISTAASIPDYRGPNGVWTLLQQGKESAIRNSSLVDAEPTLTHMALDRLVQEGKVKHIVSQNCDGLHLRSGIPPDKLSELHGNMYIEVCVECEPERQYIRLFDVTEQTSLRRHKTRRLCHKCGGHLRDTIVHFGEKGVAEKPLNWAGAVSAADDADAILCLGSSLKVLRRYQCLWNTDKPRRLRPDLYIVNLQWTPKDSQASLKINGRCDDVMTLLMKHLQLSIPPYSKNSDPIFQMATPLRPHEKNSYSTKTLSCKSHTQVESGKTEGAVVTDRQQNLHGDTVENRAGDQTRAKVEDELVEKMGEQQKVTTEEQRGETKERHLEGIEYEQQRLQVEGQESIHNPCSEEKNEQLKNELGHQRMRVEGQQNKLDLDDEKREGQLKGELELQTMQVEGQQNKMDSPNEGKEGALEEMKTEQQRSPAEGQQNDGDPHNGQDCCQEAEDDGKTENNVPGWFGKGYRKRVVKRVGRRRGSRVSSADSGT